MMEIIYPDDWHCHLRDKEALKTTVPLASFQFKRAIVMPNLNPPILNVQNALEYLKRIQECILENKEFTPLMTLYLTNNTTPEIIEEAAKSKIIFGCKLYPQGVTTYSQKGINDIKGLYPIFKTLSEVGIPLLIHGEVNDSSVDIFDRERIFIEQELIPLIKNFPSLKIVLEHISTQTAVDFIISSPENVAATITPHHLLINRNAIFQGGIKPHHYCLPILKRKEDQISLIQAAISGNPKFFIGTDSAPHEQSKKESDCGCAGIYNHHAAIELYATVFERENALDKLENFTSRFGPEFYGLPVNKEKIILHKEKWTLPKTLPFFNGNLILFMGGETLTWRSRA